MLSSHSRSTSRRCLASCAYARPGLHAGNFLRFQAYHHHRHTVILSTTILVRQNLQHKPFKAQVRLQHSQNSVSYESTIFALSTAHGRAAVANIRISGPACRRVHRRLCPGQPHPRARYAALRTISHPRNAQNILDSSALVIYFPGPESATGEDVLELHVHGGPAVVSSVLNALADLSTAKSPIRHAEPGEFTRRAFYNDKLDLTQVEALGETLNAVTEEQRRLSVQGTRSNLGQRYGHWRNMLLDARGELEALIDFSEDQHFDESARELTNSVASQVRTLVDIIGLHLANAMRGELLRNGIAVSLVGRPNVGKSSILNQIVGRNAAIVSKEPGTTRDIVEVGIDLGGFFCRLGDTAGLRHPQQLKSAANTVNGGMDSIEQEGIRRAREQAANSDVVIVVFSVTSCSRGYHHSLDLDPEVVMTANNLAQQGKRLVVVINKLDLVNAVHTENSLMDIIEVTHPQTTLVEDFTATVCNAIPSIATSAIFLISCTQAHTGIGSDIRGSTSISSSAPSRASSSASLSIADPGNFRAFLHGLVGIFREITRALHPHADTSKTDTNHTDLTKVAQSDTSIWEDSLGATTRQGQLLRECRDELNHFLDLVPGARPPAALYAITSMDSSTPTKPPQAACRTVAGGRRSPQGINTFAPFLSDEKHGERMATRGRQLMGHDPHGAADAVAFVMPDRPQPKLPHATSAKASAQAACAHAGCIQNMPRAYSEADPIAGAVPAAGDDAADARGCRPTYVSVNTASANGAGRDSEKRDKDSDPERSLSAPEDRVSAHVSAVDNTRTRGDAYGIGGAGGFEEIAGRSGEVDVVAAAEHLRTAALILGKITGRGDVGDSEEVLGVVFEKFCVGK